MPYRGSATASTEVPAAADLCRRWRVGCSPLPPELALRAVEPDRDQVVERQLLRWPAVVGRPFAKPDVAEPRVERSEPSGAVVRIASSEDGEQLQGRQPQCLSLGGLLLTDRLDGVRVQNGRRNGACLAWSGCCRFGVEI